MGRRTMVRLAAGGMAVFSLLELVSTGCGILSAPISVPAAMAANDSPGLAGEIVDDTGAPVSRVHIHMITSHVVWEPMFGQRTDGKFGKGMIRWDGTYTDDAPVQLRYTLLYQRTPGDRNLRSSEVVEGGR